MLTAITAAECALHDPVPGHPESPSRLRAVLAGLERLPAVEWLPARPALRGELDRVHAPDYLDTLEGLENAKNTLALDPDTHVGPGSVNAARLSAGGACMAVEQVLKCPDRAVFVVTRPPGHHAEASRAMGFCLLNNVAVAAAHALSKGTIQRVAICDFDVHHGNGTEAIFAGDPRVIFASSHQMPLYPGTGDPNRPVAGNVHNFALPPGAGSDDFRHGWETHLLPAVRRFCPQLVLVSAGFDAHWRDPLAQIELKDEDYFWIGQRLRNIARDQAEGRLAAVLEGGYDLSALERSAPAFAEGIR